MQSADSKTNRNAAKLAATTERLLRAVRVSISRLFAPNAVEKQGFRLSRRLKDLYIAVIASQEHGIKYKPVHPFRLKLAVNGKLRGIYVLTGT